eukprot:15446642-Alexandrium_andersonii.AAC.1
MLAQPSCQCSIFGPPPRPLRPWSQHAQRPKSPPRGSETANAEVPKHADRGAGGATRSAPVLSTDVWGSP